MCSLTFCNCLQNTLAAISFVVLGVSQLQGFSCSGGSARRDSSSSHGAGFKMHFDFDGWVSPGIKYFSGKYADDLAHMDKIS